MPYKDPEVRRKHAAQAHQRRMQDPMKKAKHHANSEAWRKAHPEYVAGRNRKHRLKIQYKWTPEIWEETFESQGRCCVICGSPEPGNNGWSVDHDHSCCPGRISCGRCVRSILCTACNPGLGAFKDNPEILRNAADYIEKWRNMKAKTAETHDLLPNQKQAPQTVGVSGPGPFKGTRAGEKRAGSTKYVDYPGESTSNPAYKGGVGDCK